MRHSCIDFLSKKGDLLVADVKMALSVVDFLLYATDCLASALKNFYIDKSYYLFNPHVGENFCQARACYLLVLAAEAEAKTFSINKRILSLNHAHDKLLNLKNSLLESNANAKFAGAKQITLKSFLAKNNCFFELSKKELFLFSCYFLTFFQHRHPVGTPAISSDEVSEKTNIPRKFARELINYYRKLLADHSCDFITYCMEFLRCNPEDMNLLQKLRKNDDMGRAVLPCYFASKVLFSFILKKQIPFLILVQRLTRSGVDFVTMRFAFDKSKRKYVRSELSYDTSGYQQPSLVISGFTYYPNSTETTEDFINRFEEAGLQRIFLANMATHPQYGGKNLAQYRTNPFSAELYKQEPNAASWLDELVEKQSWSRNQGCAQTNSSLFLAEHISCDTPQNCLSDLGQNFYSQIDGVQNLKTARRAMPTN